MLSAEAIHELKGKQFVYGLFSAILLGQVERYDQVMRELPVDIRKQFPFYQDFEKEKVTAAYDNLFVVPGDYYIPPYYSSYAGLYYDNELDLNENHLCLIGLFERFGFYDPIEQEQLPDHIAMFFSFMQASLALEVKAWTDDDEELAKQAQQLQKRFLNEFLHPWASVLLSQVQKQEISPFFRKIGGFAQEYLSIEREKQGA